ncbi:MAG: DNA-processing protein DprA [Candidatus Omnitrophota bacterium]
MQGVVKFSDSEYPTLLKTIKSPPKQLYYKGKLDSEIFVNCLAVVGSRKMTTYGKQATQKIVSEIATLGVTIVSGFMYGIDATAHKAALEGGGRTIAVMPCGINMIHPAYQEDLYTQILKNNGLIISEYEGATLPQLWTYPQRNRIIAGLSLGTLVVEAGENSGSLITAGFAKKFKRKIFSVPGPINSSVSYGTLQLIKEGASVVSSAEDILLHYGITNTITKDARSGNQDLSKLEASIIETLKNEPQEIDVLARKLKVSASQISSAISIMQIKGLIQQEGAKFYVN